MAWDDVHRGDSAANWKSPVSVGEYILISYGDRNTSAYETNANIDLLNTSGFERKSWNGVLLQKIYNATTDDLEYKELVNYTGYTPQINFLYEVLGATEEPYFIYKTSGTIEDPTTHEIHVCSYETPWALVGLPVAQKVEVDEVNEIGANEPLTIEAEDSPTGDKLLLTFNIPGPWNVKAGNIYLQPAAATSIEIGGVTYQLPHVEVRTVNADKYLDFYVAANQKFISNSFDIEILSSPTASAIVEEETSTGTYGEEKHYKLSLPRGNKTVWGVNLPNNTDYANVSNGEFIGLGVGDVYINIPTGGVHQITAYSYTAGASTATISTHYAGSFKVGTPTAAVTGTKNPYDANGNPQAVEVSAATDPNNPNAWQLNFVVPKAPLIAVNPSYITRDSEKGGSVTSANDTSTINLRIPYPTIAVDPTVTTGAEGSNASVTDTINPSEPNQHTIAFTIPRGARGYYYTPSVDANGNISWTNNGSLVNPTTQNIKGSPGYSIKGFVFQTEDSNGRYYKAILNDGSDTPLAGEVLMPRGPQGYGLKILGSVATSSDLPAAASSSVGDAYLVGTTDPKDVYIYGKGTDGLIQWINFGQLQGPQGTSIQSVEITEDYKLKITYDNGTAPVILEPPIRGPQGPAPVLAATGHNVTFANDPSDPTVHAAAAISRNADNEYVFSFTFYNMDTWNEIPHTPSP